MDTRAAIRYARALFGAAKRMGCIHEVEADLEALSTVASTPGPAKDILFEPRIGRIQKTDLLLKAFETRPYPLTADFIRLVLKKQRESELPAIALFYGDLRREDEAVLLVRVHSSEPLDESQRSVLVNRLALQTGKTLEVEYVVDPSILGGVKVTFDNFVLDGSVRGSIDRLRSTLMLDVLKQA